jgi:hypothetical protein
MQTANWSRRRWLAALAAASAAACSAGNAFAAELCQASTLDSQLVLQALVKAILPFDDPKFPDVRPTDVERRLIGVANLLADPGYRAGLAAFERSGSSAPAPVSAPFSTLSLSDARLVVAQWFASPIAERRAFVSTTKAVAVIALYSMPQVWPAINYAGPFDPKFNRDFR